MADRAQTRGSGERRQPGVEFDGARADALHLFSGGDELGNFVKIMGPENHVVPLPGSNPQKNMRFDRILAAEEVILI